MFEGEIWVIPILMVSLGAWSLSVMLSVWANGSYFRPTASNWFMWWLFVYIFFGATYLMVVEDTYEANVGLYNYPDAIMGAWGLSLAAAVLIPLGMNMANLFLQVQPNKTWHRFLVNVKNIREDKLPQKFHFVFGIMVAVTVLVSLAYYMQINIPLLGVFDGAQAKELAVLRSEAGNDFTGKYWRYALFKDSILSLLVLISFFLRHQGIYRIVFPSLLLLRSFVCLADVQKGPIINLIILLMLALFFEKQRISKKILVSIGVLICGLIITMYAFFMGVDFSQNDAISGILLRIFVAQGVGVPWSMVWVEQYGYLEGLTLPNPAGMFPFVHCRYAVELMEMVFPQLIYKGIIGSMPTVFYGDIFANFGVCIAILSMLSMGALLRSIDIYCQSNDARHTVINMVIYLFLITFTTKYAGGSVMGIFVDTGLWIPIMIMVLLGYVCPSKKGKVNTIGTSENLA